MRTSQIVQLLIFVCAVIPAAADTIIQAVNGPGAAFLSDVHRVQILGAVNAVAAFLPRFKALLRVFGGADESVQEKN